MQMYFSSFGAILTPVPWGNAPGFLGGSYGPVCGLFLAGRTFKFRIFVPNVFHYEVVNNNNYDNSLVCDHGRMDGDHVRHCT